MKLQNSRMYLIALVTIFFTFGNSLAQARDIWIHAVGIDSHEISQNMIGFYQSGEDFLSSCKRSARNPECHLLIDTDPKFSELPDELSKLKLTPNDGAGNPKKVLALVSDAIRRTKSPDQIIISLQDHGAPSENLAGHSCIYFGYDTLCENDIAPLLKNVKKGVSVFINADGCYSGAFSNLVKNKACALVGADQLHQGTSDRPSFWSLVNHSPTKNLAQLKVPTEGGTVPRMTSQLIMRSLCKGARSSVRDQAGTMDAFREFGKFRVIENQQRNEERLYHYGSIAPELGKITRFLSELSCEQLNLPQPACAAINRIVKDKRNTANKLFGELDVLFADYFRVDYEIRTLVARKTVGVDKNITLPVMEIVDMGTTPRSFDSWPADKLLVIRGFIKGLVPLHAKLMQERSALWTQMHEIFHRLQTLPSYQDWLDAYECLLPDKYDDEVVGIGAQGNPTYWNDIARRSVPLSFTEEDYQSSRQCEAGIRF